MLSPSFPLILAGMLIAMMLLSESATAKLQVSQRKRSSYAG